MKESDQFLLLAAIFIAPHLPWWAAALIAALAFVFSLREYGRGN